MREMLLYTEDEMRAREEVARMGGRVTHVLTSSVLVAELPDGAALETATTERPDGLDAMSATVADAWIASRSKGESAEGILAWDAPGYEPPC